MNISSNYTPLIGPIKDNTINKTVLRIVKTEETFCHEKVRDAVSKMYDKALNKDWTGVYPTIKYYEEAVKFPAMARLEFNDIVTNKIMENLNDSIINQPDSRSALKEFLQNQQTFILEHAKCNEHQIVQESKGKFIDRLAELYPRSYGKREAILKHKAVVLDEIVPKLKGIKKFLLKQDAKKYLNLIS